MNRQHYENFVNRYGAKVETVRPRRRLPATYTYGHSSVLDEYDYYQENTVDLELPMESFERLVALDCKNDAARAEAEIRRRYPAVADAYSQYQMLLALHQS